MSNDVPEGRQWRLFVTVIDDIQPGFASAEKDVNREEAAAELRCFHR